MGGLFRGGTRTCRPARDLGDYFAAPDASGLDITGDIELRTLVKVDDWSPAQSVFNFVSKWEAAKLPRCQQHRDASVYLVQPRASSQLLRTAQPHRLRNHSCGIISTSTCPGKRGKLTCRFSCTRRLATAPKRRSGGFVADSSRAELSRLG